MNDRNEQAVFGPAWQAVMRGALEEQDESRLIKSDDLSSEDIKAAFAPDIFELILEELRKMNAKLDELKDRAVT